MTTFLFCKINNREMIFRFFESFSPLKKFWRKCVQDDRKNLKKFPRMNNDMTHHLCKFNIKIYESNSYFEHIYFPYLIIPKNELIILKWFEFIPTNVKIDTECNTNTLKDWKYDGNLLQIWYSLRSFGRRCYVY